MSPSALALPVRTITHPSWTCTRICAMCVSSDGALLALASTTGEVLIRSLHAPYRSLLHLHTTSLPSALISCAAFASSTCLLLGRLSGELQVLRVHPDRLALDRTLSLGGGAIWALKPRDTRVLVGCDSGARVVVASEGWHKHVYEVHNAGTARGRVLCVDWMPAPVGGTSAGELCWWDAQRHTARVGADVRIWSVVAVDRQLVAADSRGVVSVWTDGQIQAEIRVERLVGNVVWTGARVGQSCVVFGTAAGTVGGVRRCEQGWLPVRARKWHEGDVKAVAAYGDGGIVTAGLDGRTVVADVQALRGEGGKIVWKLPYADGVRESGTRIRGTWVGDVDGNKLRVWNVAGGLWLRMKVSGMDGMLTAWDMHQKGGWIAVASAEKGRVYKISDKQVRRVPMDQQEETRMAGGAQRIWRTEGELVWICKHADGVGWWRQDTWGKWTADEIGVHGCVDKIHASIQLVAVAGSHGEVCAQARQGKWSTLGTGTKVAALAVRDTNVVVVRCNGDVQVSLGEQRLKTVGNVKGLVAGVKWLNQKAVVVFGETLCVVVGVMEGCEGESFKVGRRVKGVVDVDVVDKELVIVQKLWNQSAEDRPQVLKQSVYQT